ncbi:hypothetical protein TeGR_g11262 [Tetraparma gracilis]|uniref:Uncharacterized protein n=1 Tax=Tetraparma gracilis TaxID=2962635 RepID=A0ABQ6N3J8_9STRA|nr:hypothetical protein TeGR_g11262 [Tetraparma gracilis]
MAAPTLNVEKFKKNYGYGTPTWSPLYHEDGEIVPSANLVGGVLLPPLFRTVDKEAITSGLDVLKGNEAEGRPRLGWSAQETAVGCRIRDYGSGVPHWSPLYGGSAWRKKEQEEKILRYKNFRTNEVTSRPSDDEKKE